jgi:hypothetical protein
MFILFNLFFNRIDKGFTMQIIKSKQNIYIILTIIVFIMPLHAYAGAMGFKDSWMTMGDLSPNWREFFTNYAFTTRDALGISDTYMRSDDKSKTRNLAEVSYTRLLHRWNMQNAQANLWLVAGIGNIAINNHDAISKNINKLAISPSIQFDYETTRIYFAATHRLYRAKNINHDYSSVRAGFSLYETEYDQTQPWIIIEARYMNGLSDKTEITPMLRLINKNYFFEAGVNNSRQARFNFMYIF